MFKFNLLFLLIILINLNNIKTEISDERLCADEECTVPISKAKTVLKYQSPEKYILSFKENRNVFVYSKSAGKRMDLWGVEIDGKRGYAPKSFIREEKLLCAPKFLVDTELVIDQKNEVPLIEPKSSEKPYEIVDGTKIYSDDTIEPSSTESPTIIQPTVLPAHTVKAAEDEKQAEIPVVTESSSEHPVTEASFLENIISEVTNIFAPDNSTQTEDEEDEDDNEDDDDDDDDSEEDEDEELNIEDESEELNGNTLETIKNPKTDEKASNPENKIEQKTGEALNDQSLNENVAELPSTIPVLINVQNNEDQTISKIDSKNSELSNNTETSKDKPTEQLIPKPVLVEQIPTNSDSSEEISVHKITSNQGIANIFPKTDDILSKTDVTLDQNLINNQVQTEETKKEMDLSKIPISNTLNNEDVIKPPNSGKKNRSSNEKVSAKLPKKEKPKIVSASLNISPEILSETPEENGSKNLEGVETKENLPFEEKTDKDPSGGFPLPQKSEKFTITEGGQLPKLNLTNEEQPIPTSKTEETPFLIQVNEDISIENTQKNEGPSIEDQKIGDALFATQKTEEVPIETKGIEKTQTEDKKIEDSSFMIETETSFDSKKSEETLTENRKNEDKNNEGSQIEDSGENLNMKSEESQDIKSEDFSFNDKKIKGTLNDKIETERSSEEILSSDSAFEAPLLVETITESNNFEIPQPFDDALNQDVTPNPVDSLNDLSINQFEEKKKGEDDSIIATLPPLGLFNNKKFSNDIPNKVGKKEEFVPNEDKIKIEDNNQIGNEEKSYIETSVDQNVDNKDEDNNINSLGSDERLEEDTKGGIFSSIYSYFANNNKIEEGTEETIETSRKMEELRIIQENSVSDFTENNKIEENFAPSTIEGTETEEGTKPVIEEKKEEKVDSNHDTISRQNLNDEFCYGTESTKCNQILENQTESLETNQMDYFNSNLLMYLVTTAVSVIIFLFGYIIFDKNKREGPLIVKINKLENELLVVLKENELIKEQTTVINENYDNDELVEELRAELMNERTKKLCLEEQIQSLEKELENSTEVGMELNKMLTEILKTQNGNDILSKRIEQLQKQLLDQQLTSNTINEQLTIKNTENHEFKLELDINNKKILDLQNELDKLLGNILKIEEEKDFQQNQLENELLLYKNKFNNLNNEFQLKINSYKNELNNFQLKYDSNEKNLQLKINELNLLKNQFKELKLLKTNEELFNKFINFNQIQAELDLFKLENQKLIRNLDNEKELKINFEKNLQLINEDNNKLKEKFDLCEKQRVETQTKLDVLSNYFKDKEAQLQKELSKHESMWLEQQGEATSTTERMKFMQEELNNYKAQNESLKQEIIAQEVKLKSQISMLEKKVNENWVTNRQIERKLEDARQESAQLRNRLTLSERALQEEKNQNRLHTTLEQNGDVAVSPLHVVDSPASPPLLYGGGRDHITKSPPIPGLPPFLPPPPGVFMPPPPPLLSTGVPAFMPPPPTNMYPGDHRPPPLGRMSSPPPPINSRYSPTDSIAFFSRNSHSPPYDSEYGNSSPLPPPLHHRGYSPFDRRDYNKSLSNYRGNNKNNNNNLSSGSGNSNESLNDKGYNQRNHSKV